MLTTHYQKRAILERFHRVQRQLVEFDTRSESLTTGARQLLASGFEAVTVASVTFLSDWQEQIDLDSQAEDKFFELCDRHSAILGKFESKLIPLLDGADCNNIPFELETHLASLVPKIAPDWDITATVLHSEYRFNYGIGQYTTDELEALPAKIPIDHQRFVTFALPRIARDSLTLHAVLLGHELGHLRQWHSPIPTSGKVETLPEDLLRSITDTDQRLKVLLTVKGITRNWINEFVADTYSALLIGPASLLALGELGAAVGSTTHDSETHPATDRRLSVIMKVLAGQGFLEPRLHVGFRSLEELESANLRYSSDMDRDPPNQPTGFLNFSALRTAWNIVHGWIDDIVNECSSSLPPELKFGIDRWGIARDVAECLAEGRPVGGSLSKTALLPADVLNGAWLVRVSRMEDLAKVAGLDRDGQLSHVRTSKVLDDLVLKSLEILSYEQRLAHA